MAKKSSKPEKTLSIPPPTSHKKKINLGITLLLGLLIWFSPPPTGLSTEAWHIFAIFIGTIYAVITQPFPLGTITLTALTALTATNLLTFSQAFVGFSNDTIWLIVFAFFIARGFIKTGLGDRISYLFMLLLGKTTLGLAYGMVLTDLILAPAIPSVTARSGGIVYPILTSIARSCGSEPLPSKSANHVGSFLTKVVMQANCVTSAMFLTAMSANPMIAKFAETTSGFKITWGTWALAAAVPGLASLIIIPLVIYYLFPPEVKSLPGAQEMARKKLKDKGRISLSEWVMLSVFVLLIALWSLTTITPALSALIGLTILLLTGVLTWNDVKNETTAWETLIWFGVLLMMARQLNDFGMTAWFSDIVAAKVHGLHWVTGFGILSVFYFYAHYFFASNIAQVGAMYIAFLSVAISLGTPAVLAALILGFFSSLFGGLTPYSSGPAAVLYDGKYVEAKEWWQTGFLISVVNIVIWFSIGIVWWRAIGLY